MTSAPDGRLVRLWRTAPWSTNPLMRASDRFEGAVALLLVVFVLVTIPIAATVGTVRYAGSSSQAAAERAGRQQVSAVLLDDAPPAVTARSAPGSPTRIASARWVVDGIAHTGRIEAAAPARAVSRSPSGSMPRHGR